MAENHRILVVDDEEVIAGAAVRMLSAEGYAVGNAKDGEEGLRRLHSEAYDIALVDLMLPGLSGKEVLHAIKGRFPQTGVIMMTGYSTTENAIAFLRDGALDVLPKPFTFEELLSVVKRASRMIDLFGAARVEEIVDAGSPRYQLGIGTWAAIDPEGTARLGITDIFRRVVGPIEQIDLPPLHSELYQGGLLAQIQARDELKHTVWSALSGRVIATNSQAKDIINSPGRHMPESEWLAQIVPGSLESEIRNLSSLRSTSIDGGMPLK